MGIVMFAMLAGVIGVLIGVVLLFGPGTQVLGVATP